uniref:HTH CENPB-type domain-containing protein n=1 Tax=Esox lucius TaxID=8010 RepID=A0AAY5KSE5_ESOLU
VSNRRLFFCLFVFVKFAEQNSGEAAARHFSIDLKRVREWRKLKAELQRLSEEDNKRARLRGGGRKKVSEELEVSVCEWIHSMRAKHLRVSRKMIRAKAKEVYATVSDGRDEDRFTASAGWLDKFLKRNDFSVRRRTTAELTEAGEGEVESDVEEEFANELVIEDRGDDESDE